MPENGQKDIVMAAVASLIASEMTINTAFAIAIVIASLTGGISLLAWLFSRLTPSRRRDLIELAEAIRREGQQLK